MNIFKFRKVGQGLFYTGSLCDGSFNFVYDCGGSHNYIDHAIDEYCDELEIYRRAFGRENIKIDFLVLSHLHLDHFIGIMELCKRHHINKVYLPYLSDNHNLIGAILFYAIFNEITEQNYADLKTIFRFFYDLYIENRNRYISQVEFVGKESNFVKKFTFPDENPIWNFVLINRSISQSSLTKLSDSFWKEMGELGFTDIYELMGSGEIGQFKKIYSSLPEFKNDLNLSSTMLLHYPSNKELRSCFLTRDSYIPRDLIRYFEKYYAWCPSFIENNMKRLGTITLLTGDISLDYITRNALRNELDKLSGTKILQVPHHGAYDSWKSFVDIKDAFNYSVISFGLGNKYKHPNSDTILELKDTYGETNIFLVNQIQGISYIIF